MGTLLVLILVFCSLVALGCGALGAWSDFRGLTISNLYTLLILAGFVVAFAANAVLAPEGVSYFGPLKAHILAGGFFFAVTFALFSFGWLGAGDSKIGSAFALWVGMKGLICFLFYMALAGGLLAVAAVVIKNRKPFSAPPAGSWIAKIQEGQSAVPYGIAIFIGAVAGFVQNGFFAPGHLIALAGGS